MKIICEKRNRTEVVKTCRREYCCDKLKESFDSGDTNDTRYFSYSFFSIVKGRVQLQIRGGDNYNCSNAEFIDYCPFCGEKIVIENVEVDKTKDPPITASALAETPKKKHWWNW